MPYSHSIAATAVLAFTVWVVVAKFLNKPTWGLALAVAVSSHIVLDLATHVHDIALGRPTLSRDLEKSEMGPDFLTWTVPTHRRLKAVSVVAACSEAHLQGKVGRVLSGLVGDST